MSLLLALSGGPVGAYPDLPAVTAQIHSDCAVAYGFEPGALVNWQLRDAPGGDLLYDDNLQADESGAVDFCGLNGETYEPGRELTMSDGIATKTLLLLDLTIDVDFDLDLVTGTAPAGATVQVIVWGEDVYAETWVEAVGGAWSADFSTVTDLDPSATGVNAQVPDVDGDRTEVDWQPPAVPTLEASLTWDSVNGYDFRPGGTVTLTITDGTDDLIEPVDKTADEQGQVWFESGEDFEWDLTPGLEIGLTDGTSTKVVFLVPITFDELNADTDSVIGTAPPSSTVFVDLWESDGEGGGYAEVGSDGAGNWAATGADFGGLDITPSMDGQAGIRDEDGDRTTAGWQRPEPPQVPTIDGNLTWNSVSGHGFAAGATVTLTIQDGPGGSQLLGPLYNIVDGDGEVWFEVGEDGEFVLLPGMEVTVTDGTTTKVLIVEMLTIDVVNAINDTVSGTATPGSNVEMDLSDCCGGHGEAIADLTGHWTAYAATFDPEPYDITPLQGGAPAFVVDEDGDWTVVQWQQPVFEASMTPEVSMAADFIFVCCGEGWAADGSVTIQVFDGPGGPILFGQAVATDDEGSFEIGPETHHLDLVPGMHIVITGDTTGLSKELTLAELNFDALDPELDTASGNATAGSEVLVEAGLPDSDEFFCCLADVADAGGNWYVDFGDVGFDVTADMGGTVHFSGEDGDTTRAGIPAPAGPQYDFSGFFRPVDNSPTVNLVTAGQAIPLKFSLGGDFGLDVLAPGSPTVGEFACGNPTLDPIEWTASASDAGLRYDASTGQYIYVWKTSKAWAGTCQRLTLEFNDGSVQIADFKFK